MKRLCTALRPLAPRSWEQPQRHRAFVRALAGGARIVGSWPRLALTLRRAQRGSRAGARFVLALAIAPRITLATTWATTLHPTPAARFQVVTMPSRTSSTHTVVRREAIERSHATLVERLTRTERLVARISTAGVRRQGHFRRVESPAAFRPVVQTLVRSAPPLSGRTAAGPTGTSSTRPTPPPRIDARAALRAAVAEAPISGDELRRVTDHVIGELDRRVLSYRERNARH